MAAETLFCAKYVELSPAEKLSVDTVMRMQYPEWDEAPNWIKQAALDEMCLRSKEAAGETGWPWPFSLIADWLQGLWNWVGEAAVNAVSVASDWIQGAVTSLQNFVSDSVSWVWDQVKPVLGPVADFVKMAVEWYTDKAIAFLQDPLGFLSDSFTWIVDQVGEALKPVADWIADSGKWVWDQAAKGLGDLSAWITDGLKGLGDSVTKGLGDLWTAAKDSFDNVSTWISDSVSGLWDSLSGLAGDLLAGVAEALGSGFQAFMSWFMGGIQTLAVALGNGLKAVMDALSGVLGPIILGFVDSLRASFSPGSPDEETKEAVDKMVEETQKRLLEELKKAYESPFDPAKIIATAGAIAGLVLTAQVGVHGLTAAAGVEVLGTRIDLTDVVEGAINTMGLRQIVGSSFTMPLQIGLLTPLRYIYNQMFRAGLPSTGQADQMLFEGNLEEPEWRLIYQYNGWQDSHIDAWYKTMFREPNQRTLLTMLEDPEIGESWVRKKLAEIGFNSDDVDVMIDYKRRLIADKAESKLATQVSLLITNKKADCVKGYITEETLRADLEELGLSPELIEYHVADALADRARKQKDALLAIYEDGYQKDLVTDVDLETRAREILVDEDAIRIFLEKAYITKYRKPKAS